MTSDKRLFIVANRLPVSVSEENDEVSIKPASGGLVSAIKSYVEKDNTKFSDVYWAGVPGCSLSAWNEASQRLSDATFNYLPVMVQGEQYERYYNGLSNSVLWPLFHYFPSFAEYDPEDFDEYMKVNEQFAAILERNCRENDTVWIHDYHLLPLAAMLRKAIPGITIGFFLHIPFPSYELFRLLPRQWQEAILKGMLGADLIGFHTMDYALHFMQSVQMILGIHQEKNVMRYRDRLIKVDVFPISIDYAMFNNGYDLPEVASLRANYREKMNDCKIIFSVDRLDYTKGVQNRLRAYESFLKQNPEYQNKVVFVMVVVPSRDNIPKYAERRRLIDELISRINGELGTLHWQPVYYQYSTLTFEEMMSMYTICDLALITPLRDGMNLVSKEFVASRKDKKGVLILSEMAGAARELTDALIINPNDILEIAEKIKVGLTMDEEEQKVRIEKMQKRISGYDVSAWADDFMNEVETITEKQQNFREMFLDDYSRIQLLDGYRNAKKRLLLLDYDGTLVPISSSPDLAVPGDDLKELLHQLATVPGNELFLISGRSSAWLDQHFGELPIHLISEHGARVKWNNKDWQTQAPMQTDWKGRAQTIMEIYERRCANSFIEQKEFSMVWHYRNSEPEQGKLRAIELKNELEKYLNDRNLDVITGKKIVEVRNKGVNKGTAIKKVMARRSFDFVFAAGDDKTDEDMFKVLSSKQNCFTVKVGPNASYAQYNLMKPQMLVALLQNMKYLTVAYPFSVQ